MKGLKFVAVTFISVSFLTAVIVVPDAISQEKMKAKMDHMAMRTPGQKQMMSMNAMIQHMNKLVGKTDHILEAMHGKGGQMNMGQMHDNQSMMMLNHGMNDMAKNMQKFMENMNKVMSDHNMMHDPAMKKHMDDIHKNMNSMMNDFDEIVKNMEDLQKSGEKK